MEHLKLLIVAQSKKHKHFMLYSLIGFTGLTIDYLLFALGTKALGMDILATNFIAISAGITNNFFLNNKFNFKKHDHPAKRFALFYAVGLAGLILSEALIAAFHYGLGLTELIAKLFTLPPVLVFQFFFNQRFSFGDMQQMRKQLMRTFIPWQK